MIKSNDNNTIEDDIDLPEVDYSNLPDEILKAIEVKPYTITKDAKLSWDGRQFIVRIPSEIADEMGISKENKQNFKVHFEYTKPAPNTDDEPKLTIDLRWMPQNSE